MLDNFYVPQRLYPDLHQRLGDVRSFKRIFDEIFPVKEPKIRGTYSAIRFDDGIADLLEMEHGSVGFLFRTWCHTPEGELYLYMSNYFPGDRHQLELDLTAENL